MQAYKEPVLIAAPLPDQPRQQGDKPVIQIIRDSIHFQKIIKLIKINPLDRQAFG